MTGWHPGPKTVPGYWVEAVADDGSVITSVPPSWCKTRDDAIRWMGQCISEASTAPKGWSAARVVEVRLTWVKP